MARRKVARTAHGLPAGIAAGHPATAAAGRAVLAAGGSAADAAVAAVLASCVAETIFTGLAGGGYATYWSAADQTVTCLDFFTAVPGLGSDTAPAPMSKVRILFGEVEMPYSVGASTVAVPGVPAGCEELHARWGRLPWPQITAPALALARSGAALPAAHHRVLGKLTAVMLLGDGQTVYAPTGQLLEAGQLLRHPGVDRALELLAAEGASTFYRGEIADAIVTTIANGGGVLGPADLAAYRVVEVPAASTTLGPHTVWGRIDLNNTLAAFAALPPDFTDLTPPQRAVAMVGVLGGPERLGDTTNITVVDADGNACVVTTTLGLGAGVWPPGLGIHLNSMLGEGELERGERRPGDRVASMMCPLVATGPDGRLALAAGAAGASRIRTSLLETVVGVLVEGQSPADAVSRPRLHPVDGVVHAEPGLTDDVVEALGAAGYQVRLWEALMDHYFGGVSMIGRAGAGADPRRDGATILL